MRNTWKNGDYLAVDDESGFPVYASELARDWDGAFRKKDNLDGRHPQLDVRAKNDPTALSDTRPMSALDSGGDFLVQEDGLFKLILEDSSGAASDFLLAEDITVR